MNVPLTASPVPTPLSGATGHAPTKVMLELRPALEGFAGIPQETRLLFRGLRMVDGLDVTGMLQTFTRVLARGTRDESRMSPYEATQAQRINRYSRVIVSMSDEMKPSLLKRIAHRAGFGLDLTVMTLRSLLGLGSIKLTNFEAKHFGDFVWRGLFAKTLPVSDFDLVTSGSFKICSAPWNVMHRAGLGSLALLKTPRYPKLDTRGIDIFIAQTPYPARISSSTTLVVRYHDALPVMMPHTIPDKRVHQASHFHAAMENVRAGGYFACISEATRTDLLKMFPEAEPRALTIHNMVSHHYFLEESSRAQVNGVIRSRLYEGVGLQPKFFSVREQENFYARHLGRDFRYLIIVSTIEPRKNHARLLAAWEVLKADVDPDLKLVVVGTLGWDNSQLTAQMKTWIDRGQLFMLNAVPAPDLRLLYRHADATVCPSLGEGFDYSGIESMASGGLAIASDIPVHREIYDDASLYFNPYSTAALVDALKRTLYADDAATLRSSLRKRGADVAARYRPDRILPQWQNLLDRIAAERRQKNA